jgi:predicted HicB family RNase H-like nuclease
MTNLLKHNWYYGSVHHSKEDDIWYGKVLNTNGLVTYNAPIKEDLNDAFVKAVNNYVVYCSKSFINPHKIYTDTATFLMSARMQLKVAIGAEQNGLTASGYVEELLERELSNIEL